NFAENIFAQEELKISEYDGLSNEEITQNEESDVEVNTTNFPDDAFRDYVSSQFDSNQDGILSIDELNNVTSISLPTSSEITSVVGIEYFPNLMTLDCSASPQITNLDISNNKALKYLACSSTQITSLDVSQNLALEYLECYDTKITSLDVSKNSVLTTLYCYGNNFAWLNIGSNSNLRECIKTDSVIDLGQIEDSFNIATVKDIFKGIDPSKVTVVSGATYDETTGEVSDYQNGTPIVYSYDCGTMQNGESVTLTVTLNFTKPLKVSTIHINHYEGKEYDGTPVSKPTDVITTGSNGEVSFEWFSKAEDGNWESLGDQAPVNAGEYGVIAHVAADGNYAAADSGEPTPFEITKATSTIRINSYEGKVYDGTAVSNPTDITTEGSTGVVSFEWYTADGTKLYSAPVNAGSYRVKAILAADANYASAEVEKVFDITKASSAIIINDDLNKVYDGQAVMQPNITQIGSQSVAVYEWYVKNEEVTKVDPWTRLLEAPTEVGNYKLVVKVTEDMNYYGATAEVEFSIQEVQQEITPDDSSNEGANTSTENQVDGVQTGDTTQIGLWTMLAALATGIMLFFTKKKSKEEK
ncbi:MAG: MBG domain-containing protein, partial [Erysipelotrichaceae bacterium]|nr:MBG domain-containing protein [Erysipelotrichaceae bacterium]